MALYNPSKGTFSGIVTPMISQSDLNELDAMSNNITADRLAKLGNVIDPNDNSFISRKEYNIPSYKWENYSNPSKGNVSPDVVENRTISKIDSYPFDPLKTKPIGKIRTNAITKDIIKTGYSKDGLLKLKPNAVSVDTNDITVENKQGLSTVGTINLISGINTLGNVAANVIGAVNTSKMRPSLIGYRAPVEAKLVDDNTEQIRVASEESIDKNLRGAQDVNRRFGRTVSGDLISKGISATNEMSGKLAEYRKNLEATNAQIENNMAQYNDQAERNRDAQNSQIQTQFEMQKSGLMSNAIAGISSALTGGAQSLVDNTMYGKTVQLASYKNDIKALDDIIESTSVADPRRVTAVLKKQELEKGMKEFINKTYGKVE